MYCTFFFIRAVSHNANFGSSRNHSYSEYEKCLIQHQDLIKKFNPNGAVAISYSNLRKLINESEMEWVQWEDFLLRMVLKKASKTKANNNWSSFFLFNQN